MISQTFGEKNTQTRDYSLFIITANKSTVEQKAKNNQKITNTSIIPNGLSDHDAVTATIQRKKEKYFQ